MDLRCTLRYLGVPVHARSYMFGDNESVAGSSTKFDAKLHKRHTILSFQRVREAITACIVGFFHIPGTNNPADVLTKHWAYSQVCRVLRPILFWKGDTADIPEDVLLAKTKGKPDITVGVPELIESAALGLQAKGL
jgi:hypothetical protein